MSVTVPEAVADPSPPFRRAVAVAGLASAAWVALRFWFASHRPLVPDEAYYWVWSRHLAGGYFDHPPVVAYMIRA